MKNRLNSYDNMRHWLCICLMQILLVGVGHAETVPLIVKQVIAAESANQSDYGMYLVAKTIVNRARLRGLTLEQVVRQRKQYSALNDQNWLFKWLRTNWTAETAFRSNKAINEALATDGDSRLTHYHTLSTRPNWAKGHKAAIVEGKHVFYEGIK